ncbi:MAG: ArsR/SmtB family transcription factor [Hyphomicrobiales bacterium]
MSETPSKPASLARFGSLLGDPLRASILLHLGDGARRPATELAFLAGASPQALSAHLRQLTDGGLLAVECQGRYRLYAIASGETAEMIEALVSWIGQPTRQVKHDPRICCARLCYDHLAGRLGVGLLDYMIRNDFVSLGQDGPSLTRAGDDWCGRRGFSPDQTRSRRPLVRLCLDWTERRHHLGGRLAAAIAHRMLQSGYLRRHPAARSLLVTAKGARFLRSEMGMVL